MSIAGQVDVNEATAESRCVALMGGTFDPIHKGHLAIADAVVNSLGVDQVVFMPTGNPHFKLDQQVTPAQLRLEMLELATEDDARYVLDDREIRREGVTYTVDTMEELHREHPDYRYVFVIGTDAARTLVHWRGAARLAELVAFAIAARPGTSVETVEKALKESGIEFSFEFFEAPLMDVSSTQVRERVALGESFDDLVPARVVEYIKQHELYADCRASASAE